MPPLEPVKLSVVAPLPAPRNVTLRELEERYIQEVLALTGNNKTQAAHILGIHPTSLLRRLKKTQADDAQMPEDPAKSEIVAAK